MHGDQPDRFAEFLALARSQRAHRNFAPDDVPDDVVLGLLEAAVRAPNAENRQPWEFVVVREPATRRAVGELTARAWRSGGRAYAAGHLGPGLLADVEEGALGGVSGAPVLVVVGADLTRVHEGALGASLFPAVQNLLLGATALGLGSALTTLTTAFAAELAELVAMPPHVRPVAVVPLGRPGRRLGPSRRDPAAAHTHRERFGRPWSAPSWPGGAP